MNIFNNDNNVISLGILFVLLVILIYVIIRNYTSGKFIENFTEIKPEFNNSSINSINDTNKNSIINKLINASVDNTSITELINSNQQELLNSEIVDIDNINYNVQLNNNKLKYLQNQLEKKQKKDKYPDNTPVKSIKSKYNSQILTVIHQDNKYYKIQINDKCLSVYSDNNYKLTMCDNNEPNFPVQLFYHEIIKNSNDIKKIYGEYPSINTNYPFSVFKSATTDQFLTSTDNGISIEPGVANDIRQQWFISPVDYICS